MCEKVPQNLTCVFFDFPTLSRAENAVTIGSCFLHPCRNWARVQPCGMFCSNFWQSNKSGRIFGASLGILLYTGESAWSSLCCLKTLWCEVTLEITLEIPSWKCKWIVWGSFWQVRRLHWAVEVFNPWFGCSPLCSAGTYGDLLKEKRRVFWFSDGFTEVKQPSFVGRNDLLTSHS